MSSENRNTIKFKFFGRREVPVEVFTAMTSLVSTAVGVLALVLGSWQFSKSLEKTDEQITFLKHEIIERNQENRPLVRATEYNVETTDREWHFNITFVNDGKRQADSMIIRHTVLAYDGNENLANSNIIPMYDQYQVKHGGLFPSEILKDSKPFDRIDHDIYLVRFDIEYRDVVSNDPYPLIKYYKIDLNYAPAKVREYYDEQKHSDSQLHDGFHQVFDIYFPQGK
ncbi:MAG: hypothetical protein V4687_01100 [Bacteroidota bacterium]